MVWAYFDETAIHTKDAATGKLIPTEMLVGGCLASAANWQRLSAEWKRALKKEKVKVFHSKDFYAFRREFAWHTKSGKREVSEDLLEAPPVSIRISELMAELD